MFHVGKHALKYIAFTHDYEISAMPLDQAGVRNDLHIRLSGMDLTES